MAVKPLFSPPNIDVLFKGSRYWVLSEIGW